ncbi:protein involved in gliding motility GldK [Pseudopedobacter saltans DSM 12145]|uniref:Protein involved in gliding motility GldK n=1 Tax=Pseudopedobacter saltans (strain ATCC 51119 / DSM 12145 / JCM 21818 / CCUG 39354 / LMG 10337 / NBRC 100064 / NCIMB 13643) TaxID=762903 RepID=F0S4P9_PSESL|nr:SUMF1/EgtB/PvdO family nonheme iron enzyme [Pseudopedobacter saltans]ADY53067.1 protein involved in gliding motility GldK [Pseudopedobacter saltans DSM 12145]
MKIIYSSVLLISLGLLVGCGGGTTGGRGELTGVKSQKAVRQEVPYGMVYIPAGTFVMGQVDQDVTISQFPQNKQVTISAFYMDETEITNSEYKQFVHWVRDSIAVKRLGNGADKYMLKPKGKDANTGATFIDWKKVQSGKGIWGDKALVEELNKNMYYQDNERFFGKKELNVEQLKYDYEWIDYRKAADMRGARDPNRNKNGLGVTRDQFIVKEEVYVYPDTLVWISDFTYAQNDPMTKGYFSHPSFANYPVVGVSWKQAKAFTVWRSRLNEAYKTSRNLPSRLDYDLPTEAQFEYAARGGRVGTTYPWGGPYIRNAKGCLLANFKPGRGNYIDDGGAFTVYAKSYFPNDYGLYNMAGNVAEWTSSIYNPTATAYINTLNPSYDKAVKEGDPDYDKRRVVKGGSWKDIGYFLQNSAKSYEYPDSARSSIGFRCVTPFVGRDIKDKPSRMKP